MTCLDPRMHFPYRINVVSSFILFMERAMQHKSTLLPNDAPSELRKTTGHSVHESGLCLDMQRMARTGMGEVVLAEGKDDTRLLRAMAALAAEGPVLATRVNETQGRLLSAHLPDGDWWPDARLFAVSPPQSLSAPFKKEGDILVVTGGATDLPVAFEALGTLRFNGIDAGLVSDVGVAGLHRLAPHMDAFAAAKVLIVVAGMEGTLPGIVAGLVKAPVVAVPTSVGYGTGLGGLSAMLTMLNACAPGLAVVNIDNGYGAAAFAVKMIRQATVR